MRDREIEAPLQDGVGRGVREAGKAVMIATCRSRPVQIMIIDDHRLFTAGLAAVIQLLPRPLQVLERDNARTALRELEAGLHTDLLLVDVAMPCLNGLDLLHALAARDLPMTSIVVSATVNPRLVEGAFAAGARGFVPKALPPATVIEAIETVLGGGTYVPPHLTRHGRPSREPLLPGKRQLEILGMIERGLSNKEIADVLDVSVSTIKFHVSALFRELGVRTRTECVHVARQRSLMD